MKKEQTKMGKRMKAIKITKILLKNKHLIDNEAECQMLILNAKDKDNYEEYLKDYFKEKKRLPKFELNAI